MKSLSRLFAFILANCTLVSQINAHEFELQSLRIIHPHIVGVAGQSEEARGQFVVSNEGTTPDRLIGVSANFAETTIVIDEIDGTTHIMKPISIEIPPGESVVLMGGDYFLFQSLNRPLVKDDMFYATIKFENSGEIMLDFVVEPYVD